MVSFSASRIVKQLWRDASPTRCPQLGQVSLTRFTRVAPCSRLITEVLSIMMSFLSCLRNVPNKKNGVRRTLKFLLYSGPVVAQTAPVAQSVKPFAAHLQLIFRWERPAIASLSPDRPCNIARIWGKLPMRFLSRHLKRLPIPVHTRGRVSSFSVCSLAQRILLQSNDNKIVTVPWKKITSRAL